MPYGLKDMFTNPDGDLVIWIPAGEFLVVVTMEDGDHCFHIRVDPNGQVSGLDFLRVNDEFVLAGTVKSGTGWACDGTNVMLSGNALVQGSATNGAMRLFIPSGGSSNVTLSSLTMLSTADSWSPVVVSNAAVSLAIQGTNALEAAGQYSAGIQVCSNAALTLCGEGVLFAQGGRNAAGIGSAGGFPTPGTIRILSGEIHAVGGYKAAGIGGGVSSTLRADNIFIEGGHVTAQGGENAAGIGSGYVQQRFSIPAGAVRISGGTVLAARGTSGGVNFSDLVMSGNASPVTGRDDPLVITGGSVHGAHLDVRPRPVDDGGELLNYLLFTDLTPGAELVIASEELATYGLKDVVADEMGSVCFWLPETNVVRTVRVGDMYFSVDSSLDNVFSVTNGMSEPPESRLAVSQTVWRVLLPQVTTNATVELVGLEPYATNAFVNVSSNAYVYLPDGDYAFTVNGEEAWAVCVSGMPVVAHAIPQSLHIESIAVGADTVTLGVSAAPSNWLGRFSSILDVRAAKCLPFGEGNDLVSPADMRIVSNTNGTVTITIPRAAAERMFYKVKAP